MAIVCAVSQVKETAPRVILWALVGVNLQLALSVELAPTAAPTSRAGKLARIPW